MWLVARTSLVGHAISSKRFVIELNWTISSISGIVQKICTQKLVSMPGFHLYTIDYFPFPLLICKKNFQEIISIGDIWCRGTLQSKLWKEWLPIAFVPFSHFSFFCCIFFSELSFHYLLFLNLPMHFTNLLNDTSSTFTILLLVSSQKTSSYHQFALSYMHY